MGTSLPNITPAELRILKVLWERGPQTVRQMKQTLTDQGGDEPAYTTVMTMMKQLAEKGALRVDRQRHQFVYTPTVRRDQVLRQRLTQFLHTVFDDKVEDMVLQLAEETELSASDLRRIEAKIARQEAEEKKRKPGSSKSKGRAR